MWDDDLSIFVFKLIEHKPNILRLGETFDGISPNDSKFLLIWDNISV